VKPIHYDISLFDLDLGGTWKYKGVVKIDTKVVKPTKEIVLNAKEIEVQNVEISTKNGMLCTSKSHLRNNY
jgi:aminopeptidase N